MSTPADQLPQTSSAGEPSRAAPKARWAWWGVLTGVLGLTATVILDVRPPGADDGSFAVRDVALLERVPMHVSGAIGYVVVLLLLVLAASWRRHVEPSLPSSTAARVVSAGIAASAAALTLGYGWKLSLGLYLPGGLNGGLDRGGWDTQGLAIYYVLTDFGAWIGWLGVTAAAAAMMWLGLIERVVPMWIGIISVIPVLAVLVVAMGLAVAGFPGIVGPLWLVIAFAGLALSRRPLRLKS